MFIIPLYLCNINFKNQNNRNNQELLLFYFFIGIKVFKSIGKIIWNVCFQKRILNDKIYQKYYFKIWKIAVLIIFFDAELII